MQQIGRYIVVRELGKGAMGVVFEARDPLIGRVVAVKIIRLDALGSPSEVDWLQERLFREARSAGALSHPGIVVIYDLGRHEDVAYIAMERVDGPTLEQVVATGARLSTAESLNILRQTAAALDYAHQNGVVHRDIKPGNLMLHKGVTLKIADFGIAKIASTQQLTKTGMVMGTPSYMSPEQITAQPVDGRADQFSLAVIAFEMLAGRKPFQGDALATLVHKIVYEERPSARSLRPDLPEAADAALKRRLSRNPGDRHPSCAAFVDALEHSLLEHSLAQAPRQAVAEKLPPRPAAFGTRCQVCGAILPEGQLQCSVCANFAGTETFFRAAFGDVAREAAGRNIVESAKPVDVVAKQPEQMPPAAPEPQSVPSPVPPRAARPAQPELRAQPASVSENAQSTILTAYILGAVVIALIALVATLAQRKTPQPVNVKRSV
jgi:predicted Ser/Thr protein kinase